MKTRVDLYLQELRPRYELLTLGTCLFAWILALFVVAGATLWVKQSSQALQVEALQVDAQFKSKKQLVDVLTAKRDSRSKDPKLVSEIESLQRMLAGRRAILNELKKQEQLKSQGFSGLMLGLAQNQQDDLWLTRVRIEEQQLLLTGGASESASLPRWISKLQQSEFFQGRQFKAAKLYRDDTDLLVFEIGTLIENEQQDNQAP